MRVKRFGLAACAALALLVGGAVPAAAQDDLQLPSGRTEYRTLADYESDMQALVDRRPDLVAPLTLPHKTTEGRTVRGVEITRDVQEQDGKPVFLLVGMHHGNEWASGEVSMEFGIDLVQSYDRDWRIRRLLDHARIVLVPIVNVDGFVRNTRRTATNVDMNRNFGFGWGESPPFQGSGPFSEPETRNMRDLVSTRQPTTLITMHTCLANMLYPPLQKKAGPTPDLRRYEALGDAMSTQNGYPHLASADDAETTGEIIDWSYYATRALSITIEVCATPYPTEERTFKTLVQEEYNGTGPLAGKGNRGALLKAFENAADPREHSVIVGHVRRGAKLSIRKDFTLWTNPFAQPDGGVRPAPLPTTLTSSMTVSHRSGLFLWHVNPSTRPVPPYQEDGLHGDHAGFLPESWTLTCARPDGKVLQTERVRVDLGEIEFVNLKECRKRLKW